MKHKRPEPTRYINFPEDVRVEEYLLTGYFQGEEHCTTKGLTLDHFDVISYLRKSPSQKSRKQVIHVIGHRTKERQETVLTLVKPN